MSHSSLQTAFLKCYYWYKNWWDELLFFGVIFYIQKHYKIHDFLVEVWDRERFALWLDRHSDLIPDNCHIQPVKPGSVQDNQKIRYVFGWWEVFTDHVPRSTSALPFPLKNISHALSRWFTRAWRNYVLKYPRAFLAKRVILLGGIGIPTKETTKFLYRYFLPRVHAIITREKASYTTARTFADKKTQKTILYHDFALDVITQYTCHKKNPQKTKPYIIINGQYQQDTSLVVLAAKKLRKKYPDSIVRYFPCEHQDTIHIPEINKTLGETISVYNRQNKTIHQTCCFIAHAESVLCARLHIALIAQYYNVELQTIDYAPKIQAMLSHQKGISHKEIN